MGSVKQPTRLLDLVDAANNVPPSFDFTPYYKLLLPNDPRPHGFVLHSVVSQMPWAEGHFVIDHTSRTIQVIDTSASQDTGNSCTEAFQKTVCSAIEADIFPVIHGDHSELVPILGAKYNDPVLVERYPAPLFGIAVRGVHLVAYTYTHVPMLASHSEQELETVSQTDQQKSDQEQEEKELRIWIARRSPHIFTYPSALDTTAAGGIKAGDSPLDCLLSEAEEEASLDQVFMRKYAKPTGLVSYVNKQPSTGYLKPTLLYLYDVELPKGMVPRPNDNEVDGFYLWTVRQVKEAMLRNEFKPNCALVMIDFFVRHGILTPEMEPDYVEIISRLRATFPIPVTPGNGL